MSKKTTPLQTYEIYNHKILWGAARRNLVLAQGPAKKDQMFWALGSMILTYCAFEGYLNWLGASIDPVVWKDERSFFSRSPYQGTTGKYIYLSKILCLAVPDFSKEPSQTVKALTTLRNMSVHPKAEKGSRSAKLKKGSLPTPYISALEKRVSPKKAKRALKHIKQLCGELHKEARVLHHGIITGKEPFDGIIGFESGDA